MASFLNRVDDGRVEKPKALWLSARAQSIAEALTADFRVSSVAHLLHFWGENRR